MEFIIKNFNFFILSYLFIYLFFDSKYNTLVYNFSIYDAQFSVKDGRKINICVCDFLYIRKFVLKTIWRKFQYWSMFYTVKKQLHIKEKLTQRDTFK